MLVPQFTLRTALLGMSGFAFLFLLIGMGLKGEAWAIGVATALGSFLVLPVFFALFFILFDFMGNRIRNNQALMQHYANPASASNPASTVRPLQHDPLENDEVVMMMAEEKSAEADFMLLIEEDLRENKENGNQG